MSNVTIPTTPAPVRRSLRYSRDPDAPKIRLTEDDLLILRETYRHRVIRSPDFERLLPWRSSKHIQHRLRWIYDNHYLDRIPEDAPAGMNPPLVYALGNRGAEALGIRRSGVDWTEKNKSYKSRQLKHALLVSELCIAIRWSCFLNQIRFILPEEILENAPVLTRQLQRPFRWKVSVSRPGNETMRETVRPDYIFGLEFTKHPTRPGAKRYFMVEVDRGTEPQRRKEPSGPYAYRRLESIADKLFLYDRTLTAWEEGKEVKPFGFTKFFVLVATERGMQRVANMVTESKRMSGGTGVYSHRFADFASVRAGDALAMPWLTGTGKKEPLVEWLAPPPNGS